MNIVLSRFLSINLWNQKYGLDFLPVALAGMVYGPVAAAIVAGMGDFIGAILFPFGPYFPGFTLTACAAGYVLGLFLHKEQTLLKTTGAVMINQVIISLFANTFWISVLYGSQYAVLLATRLPQCCVMSVIQIILITAVSRAAERIIRGVAV